MNKLFKKVLASALALTLVLPGMVNAAGFTQSSTIPVNKDYLIKTGTQTNGEVFNFELTPATSAEGVGSVLSDQLTVKAGTNDLLKLSANSLTFTAGEAGTPDASNSGFNKISKSLNLVVKSGTDLTSFEPGVYRYILKETASTVDGIATNIESKTYVVDVYVTNDTNGGKISTVYAYDGAAPKTTAELTNAKVQDIKFVNKLETKDLIVKKVITGNAADLTKKFAFTIEIVGQTGETFKHQTTVSGAQASNTSNGTTFTVSLGNNEEIKILGLSPKDTYKITEVAENYSSSGQVTSATEMGTSDKTVTVTNTLNATIPTGVLENIAPFAIILVVSGVFAFIYFRKRDREEA